MTFRQFTTYLDSVRRRQHTELVTRMALAGVPEDEWPEYEGSGEEQSFTDEQIEVELASLPFIRRVEPS